MKQKLPLTILLIIVFCIQLAQAKFQPHKAKFLLVFDYAARQITSFDSSSFQVIWNGHVLFSHLPTDYDVHTFALSLKAHCGNNTLQFAGTGVQDSLGATITNIKFLRQTICGEADTILNGDFSFDKVGNGFKVVSQTLGWTATNKLEIGYGQIYNSNWPAGTHITELDVNVNTVITQVIVLDDLHRVIGW